MSAQFTGSVKNLYKRATERGAKYSNNHFSGKLLLFQKSLSDRVVALEDLHANRKPGESGEEILRFSSKFKNELPKILDDFRRVSVEIESSMRVGAYEHSGLLRGEFDAEIRSYVRSMPFADRISFIIEAFKNKEAKILGAILHDSIPAALAGIDTKTQEKYREDFFRLVIPEFMEVWDSYKYLEEHAFTTYKVAEEAVGVYGDEEKLKRLDEQEKMNMDARKILEEVEN